MTLDLKAIREVASVTSDSERMQFKPSTVISLLDRLEAAEKALAEPAVEPISCQWLAEMIMADLGYSSNDSRMLAKITERIVDYDRSNAPPTTSRGAAVDNR